MLRVLLLFAFTSIPLSVTATSSLCESLDGTARSSYHHENVTPMTSKSPFTIVTSRSTAHQSEILTIRIESALSEFILGGFTVHAASTTRPSNKVLGRFITSTPGLTLTNCNGEDSIATYHAYPGAKGDIELKWQAPHDYLGEIVFNATFVQDFDKIWEGVTSEPVEVVQREVRKLRSFLSSLVTRTNATSNINELPSSNTFEQRSNDPIYEGCGTTKTCLGLPNNCIEQQTCQAVATAFAVDGRYFFELQSSLENVAYVAVGLSRDDRMGEDSVMECINEGGTTRVYTSYNNPRGNTREGVPQSIIAVENASYVNGTIYCRMERQVATTVLGIEYDLLTENYHFLLAIGSSVGSAALSMHDLGRTVSAQPLQIIKRDADNAIYNGCGTTKTCLGVPLNCVDQRTCNAVVTATIVHDRYIFEMESGAANVAYVAFALSTDVLMGNDSVIECVREDGTVRAYSSWNDRRSNTREGVPQNIFSLISSSLVNGRIYCKLERDTTTTVMDKVFDLQEEQFHIMVAIGTNVLPNMILAHNLGRLSSPEPLEIIRRPDPIYQGCDDEKTCFGMPIGCVELHSCAAIVAVTVDDGEFDFELQSGVATVGYVSFALSTDNLMGDDSVIECMSNGSVYTSWNDPHPTFTNTRQGVPQGIIRVIDSSYENGRIYCKVRRDASSIVQGKRFDLTNDDFYYLLAIGRSFTANSISIHDLGRVSSPEHVVLPGRGSSVAVKVKISAISFVVLFFATICAHSLRH